VKGHDNPVANLFFRSELGNGREAGCLKLEGTIGFDVVTARAILISDLLPISRSPSWAATTLARGIKTRVVAANPGTSRIAVILSRVVWPVTASEAVYIRHRGRIATSQN
jgi:hypothetical protein